MDPEDKFRHFLEERSAILQDIEQFLFMTFRYFSKMGNDFDPEIFVTETVRSLIKSLCLIHGLYGYPEPNSSANNITVNKHAVRTIVLNKIKENGNAFVDFCKEANKDEFWQFRFEESNTTSLLREPAHIFLQLVRDQFGEINVALAAKIGQKYLEGLPDINFLKPVVWAEHKDKSECCGVSLGVRAFVRPLFLYIKLSQLRNVENGHNGVNLKDVKAFGSDIKRHFLLKADPPSNKKSEYKNEKAPCESCQVFFGRYELSIAKHKTPSFPPFGNCAEYDVIRTSNLDSLLRDLAQKTPQWALFESACQHHYRTFNELNSILELPGDPSERIKTYYYKSSSNAKILNYQKYAEMFMPQFKLVAQNWPRDERQEKTTKKKRRKTVL